MSGLRIATMMVCIPNYENPPMVGRISDAPQRFALEAYCQ